MKKTTLKLLPLCILVLTALFLNGCSKGGKNAETTVRLNEVVHSIFYAPQYAAIANGYFTDEGIKIELEAGQGADKSMTALLSANADIALLGTEAGIYVYNEGREDFAVAFAQLTQRAGNFLVAREQNGDFKWESLRGKTIIGGRAGGMPQMVLEYVLKQKGIDFKNGDVEILTNLQYTSTAGAFAGGVGDYTAEFDPSAYALEQVGAGTVVSSLGTESGSLPYTVYMATKSYLKANADTVQRFTNAVYRGQLWVAAHTAEEVAKVIAEYFPENSLDDLTVMVGRYKAIEAWRSDPAFDADAFTRIQDIMEQGGELSARVPFNKLIDNSYAEKAVKTVNAKQ
ncbi:nitrate ABC transporter substrate-binding protein [Clostridia bacterium]|nr:nitrate ABC transporter substrate-binding protein [Clostridia bacterium]